jgi:hypothetical protein
MSKRVRIWSNGEEFRIWEANNCDRCVKFETCEIAAAIAVACFDDGTLAPAMVKRLGYTGEQRFWCQEIQTWGKPEPKPAAHEVAAAGTPCLPGFDDAAQERAAAGGEL